MKSLRFLVILITVSTASTAMGATFNVTNPAEFQTALSTAAANNENDIINVAAGAYNIVATLTYQTDSGDGGHSLTIQGAGAASTILSGGGTAQIMNINTDTGFDGGDDGGHIVIRAMTFRAGNNAAGTGGGANIFTFLASITGTDCIFNGNTANGGGGLSAGAQTGSVTLTGNTFSNNTSSSDGGGAIAGSGSGTVTVSGNTFSGNSAAVTSLLGGGGGLGAVGETAVIRLVDNQFSNNRASSSAGGGAAVLLMGNGTVALTGNSFSNNTASVSGGGAWVFAVGTGAVSVLRNTFSGNTTSGQGGGAAGGTNGVAIFADNVFLGNSAVIGGGLVTGPGSGAGVSNVVNNTFSGNIASVQGGGLAAALFDELGTLNIYNNIFWSNSASAGGNDGDDVYVDADIDEDSLGGPVNLFNSDFSGAADFASAQSEDLVITVIDQYSQGGNIQQDPLFVNAGSGDLHLQAGSPCIDTGNHSAPSIPATDFEGEARVMDGNGDGTAVPDMGADEFTASPLPSSAVAVPTMNEWGMIIFALLAGLAAVSRLQGHEQRQHHD